MDLGKADYFGTGLSFPMGVDSQGRLAVSSGIDRIEQAIGMILRTSFGERVMRPEFGCGVWDYVFAPINQRNLDAIATATHEAIDRWEPRVDLEDVTVTRHPNDQTQVLISITYLVAATNDRRNLVYPFYVIPTEVHP